MEPLKLKRSGLRASFTKTANFLKAELLKEDSNLEAINDKSCKLQNLNVELNVLDEKIMDFLTEMEGATEESVLKEMESREVYSDDFITLSRQINAKLGIADGLNIETRSVEGSNVSCSNKVKSYKLPKIELKKFDGNLINWLPFWSQFEKIHDDADLHDSDKFSYLVQSMKEGSRAKEFIDSYPVTSANYSNAIDSLKERFGKSELLIEVYVRELIKLIITNVKADTKDKLPLDKLFDKLEAHLRALDSLGLDSNSNSAWLYPMVESCLTEDVLRAWQRSLYFNKLEESESSRLKNLVEFLKAEVQGEERLKLARSGFEGNIRRESYHQLKGENKGKTKFRNQANIPTASGFLTTRDSACIFCGKSHESKNCYEARRLTLEEKIAKVKDKKCCLKCLAPNHIAKFCKQFVRCYACGKSHIIILCPEMQKKVQSISESPNTTEVQTSTAGPTCTSEVALMTLKVKVFGANKIRFCRVMLDSGSQKSYISKSLAVDLGLPIASTETLSHTLFGGTHTNPKSHNKYRVQLCSMSKNNSEKFEFEFLDQNVICGNIPCLPKGPILRDLKRNHIWLSDMGPDCPKIEMLIGSDVYGKILTGHVKQLNEGLTAICTKLGWVVCGTLEGLSDSKTASPSLLCANLAIRDMQISDLWNLETIGILDDQQGVTKRAEEEMAMEQLLHSLTRNDDGRYCVGLPWLGKNMELPSNRHVAEKRLFSVTRKLESLNKYDDYDKVFQEWEDEGVIEVVPEVEIDLKGYYLPHHPVFKPDSLTTKVRPVFDASCKVGRSPSLNDCLFKGPNLIEEIPSILLRFREKCIGVTSDIRRAFLQINVREEDLNFLKFLWWEKKNVMKVYRHTKVVFGITSSPFLLGAVISYHLSQVPEEEKVIARMLAQSLYVDNCVTSVDDLVELKNFIVTSTEILARAKMDLRMWMCGPIDDNVNLSIKDFNFESSEDPLSVLGVLWNRKEDTLSIKVRTVPLSGNLSKRKILSLTQTVFDPLGFLVPIMLPAKLLLQEIWAIKADWDAPLPEGVEKKFLRWYSALEKLTDFNLPRRIGFGVKKDWSLHIFCDASQHAYAAAIYLRCEENGEVFISLVIAKSRVAPLKGFTIPRLELMACVLGARLSKYVTEALSMECNPKYFWTDSTTALSWIKRNNVWGTFVGNRVREICTVTNETQWYYVPTNLNPADLPSRGSSSARFIESHWIYGPVWLKGPRESWPTIVAEPNENLVSLELKKGSNLNCNFNVNSEPKWYERYSEFSKIVKILGWVKRFVSKCRKQEVVKEQFLNAMEIQKSRNALLLLVQRENFPANADSINGLSTERDESGLIRVKTKIVERDDEYAFRYPILLPPKHFIVETLVREYHLKNSHVGVQALTIMLREEYWILSARRTVRSVVRRCVRCKRFTSKPPETVPIHLPLDRVRDAYTFEVTGIDLCGPLLLRNKTKTWVVLFTCAVYRCVHLELVSAISTEYFIQALRRFIARRGRPSVIYSDNGTNFVGTSSALRKVDWERVASNDTLHPINWKFIPPSAAWWGGWWERLIRTTKELLVRVLGQASVNYEELLTILCDAEAVINSRPLTYISNDIEDLSPLTPSMFMQDIKIAGTADLDAIDGNKLLVRQQRCQELREQLRNRFRKEYLAQLVQRHSQSSGNVQVGDIVLVGAENIKRINWPIARVQELCKGRDGRVRVVKVKTHNGILTRPVRKLYPLEVRSSQQLKT